MKEVCTFGDQWSVLLHNEDNDNQGKKHKKDTEPDKATAVLVKDFENFGCISRKTQLLREPTDGSSDVRRSILKTGNISRFDSAETPRNLLLCCPGMD